MANAGIPSSPGQPHGARWSRRRLLRFGAAGAVALAGGGTALFELVSHGVLPGQQLLDRLDGACSVSIPPMRFAAPGPAVSGRFYSRARRCEVGYTISYPPSHAPGARLPLVVALHGYGGDHRSKLGLVSPVRALALLGHGGAPLPPMAMVTADGGGGYWNPHPGDDPMAMVTGELIPLCQRRGLGGAPERTGVIGISMGGYGALLLTEKFPRLFAAAVAISPAIWTSYQQARAVNAGAFASAADFAACDVITHAAALAGKPVLVASGASDPFHPGVVALSRALPRGAVVDFSQGCHTASFQTAQLPAAMAFLAKHLAGSPAGAGARPALRSRRPKGGSIAWADDGHSRATNAAGWS